MRPSHLSNGSWRLVRVCLLAVFGGGAVGAPAVAQEIVLRAFGDSITEGYGDPTPSNGYAERIERWMNTDGYDALVTEHGVGGETTAQGLSRIDEVLALGGDVLLLMEGTNDISQHVGIESIQTHLDEMASRAEDLGMAVIHGTVIPRHPTAVTDSNNARTSALATAILELGADRGRLVADHFHHFESLPDVFENYYYVDPEVADPVGHPNTEGYIQIGGLFYEVILELLEGPQLRIVVPSEPLVPGGLLTFEMVASASIQWIDWTFGDGGVGQSHRPGDLSVQYAYFDAGSYTVTATGESASGVLVDTLSIEIAGPPVDWSNRIAVLPSVSSAPDGALATDLLIDNSSASHGLVEVAFLPDIVYDDPAPPRRLFVPPGGLELADVLPGLFDAPNGRGAFEILAALPGNSQAIRATARVRAGDDPEGSSGCDSAELPESAWSNASRILSGVALAPGQSATLHVANLDPQAGSVRLDFYDNVNAFLGSGLFEIGPGASRQREVGDLFRGLASLPQPFTARFVSSGIRYSAAIVIAGPGAAVSCAVSTP